MSDKFLLMDKNVSLLSTHSYPLTRIKQQLQHILFNEQEYISVIHRLNIA